MDQAKTLYQQAITFFKQNELTRSVELLEQALALESENLDMIEALGVIYGKLKRFDEAMRLMKKLISLSPDHIMAHANLSQFYAERGMITEAEAEQAEARRLSWKAELRAKKMSDSEIDKIVLEESKVQEEVIQKKIEQYKKVIEYDPKDVLGYFTLGTAYTQGKYYIEAESAFRTGIEMDLNHSPSYSSLGEVLELLGKKNEAIEIYKQGIPVADKRGDIIPLRKMESRLRKLSNP